jgi:chlorite dismutase
MRNIDGLTPKEFIFCEEYLKDGNMERAYRVAYPHDKGRNAWRTVKRKEVISYINKRIQEKQSTYSRLKDKRNQVIYEKLSSPSDMVVLEAAKIITRMEEMEAKFKELEVADKSEAKQITINIHKAEPDK